MLHMVLRMGFVTPGGMGLVSTGTALRIGVVIL